MERQRIGSREGMGDGGGRKTGEECKRLRRERTEELDIESEREKGAEKI